MIEGEEKGKRSTHRVHNQHERIQERTAYSMTKLNSTIIIIGIELRALHERIAYIL